MQAAALALSSGVCWLVKGTGSHLTGADRRRRSELEQLATQRHLVPRRGLPTERSYLLPRVPRVYFCPRRQPLSRVGVRQRPARADQAWRHNGECTGGCGACRSGQALPGDVESAFVDAMLPLRGTCTCTQRYGTTTCTRSETGACSSSGGVLNQRTPDDDQRRCSSSRCCRPADGDRRLDASADTGQRTAAASAASAHVP